MLKILELGYDSDTGFSADFTPGDKFKISLTEAGKITITQGSSRWKFDGTSLQGAGYKSSFTKLISASLMVSPATNGNVNLSGSLSYSHSILGITLGGTTSMNFDRAVLNNSGLFGNAARALHNRQRRIDCAVDGDC